MLLHLAPPTMVLSSRQKRAPWNGDVSLMPAMQAADADVLEKTVDCLRILTTGNDSNKVALFTIPAGVPSLVRLLSTTNPDQVGLMPRGTDLLYLYPLLMLSLLAFI